MRVWRVETSFKYSSFGHKRVKKGKFIDERGFFATTDKRMTARIVNTILYEAYYEWGGSIPEIRILEIEAVEYREPLSGEKTEDNKFFDEGELVVTRGKVINVYNNSSIKSVLNDVRDEVWDDVWCIL